MTQPQMIDQILQDLGYKTSTKNMLRYATKSMDTPATSMVTLMRDLDGPPHNEKWEYQSVIGKLNFLEKSTRPDLMSSVHNVTRFSADPKVSHSQAVKRIGHYLLGTLTKGIDMTPDPSKGLEVFADADFCRLFNPETALYDPVTAKSRTGYIIMYMNCPIVWASKLQTETMLSTCEAEYTACSKVLGAAIPLMNLINEAASLGIPIKQDKANIYCKLFCDKNTGAVELLKLPKIQPRTKHINARLHHF